MKKPKSLRLLSLLLLLALATVLHVGCSQDGGLSPVGPEKIVAPPSALITTAGDGDDDDDSELLSAATRDPDDEGITTALIGPLGGVVMHGDHRVIIPAGALSQTVEISFSVPDSDTLMFDLAPHGTQFNVPIILEFEYDNADLAGVNESALQVGYYNDSTGAWDSMPTTVDTVNDVIIGQTTHFSRYAILR